jgi:dihydrofolate reductase (trimethoprim resistance protein)
MKFTIGDKVRKISGSSWYGQIVGTYSTQLTPEGYCVESSRHPGSVQIYPAAALERWNPTEGFPTPPSTVIGA